MRSVLPLLLIAVAGCAGQPSSAPGPAAVPAATGAPANSAASSRALSITKVATSNDTEEAKRAAAKKLGYTLVSSRDGDDLYCTSTVKTGSRLMKETVCATPAELERRSQQTQQAFSGAGSGNVPRPNN